ncbi:MAG: TldD/PmbA family protein [Nitrospinota bacterium]
MDIELYGKSIIDKAISGGGDEAEVYVSKKKSTNIGVKGQKVDSFEQSATLETAIRVIKDGKLGFSYTTITDGQAVGRLVKEAIENALSNEPDKYTSFAAKAGKLPELGIYDSNLPSISEAEKIDRAMRVEKSALSYDSRVDKVRSASYGDTTKEILILSSSGLNVSWLETICGSSIEVTAKDENGSEVGSDYDYQRYYSNLKVEEIGIRGAKTAIDMLGGRNIETRSVPVIIENTVASQFLSILASSFKGDSVQKGKSMLIGKTGLSIVSPKVNIIDNGRLEGGIGSSPVDDEGTPTKCNVLINKGILTGFLHNRYTAAKENIESAGNGTRGSFKLPPSVGLTNLYINKGTLSVEDLMSDIGDGFYITEAMGVHTADPISGDFSIGTSGLWIKGGKKAYPVRGVAIAGNMLDLFMDIVEVGNDLRFFGGIGSPSLRIKNLTVCGK